MNQKDLKRLQICNTSNFKLKQDFYILKHKLIKKYGKRDGYDMQEIIKKCYCCDNGIIRSNTTGEQMLCSHCGGTSQYRVQYWKLNRYLINGELFYLPEYSDLNSFIKGYRFLIKGKITHEKKKGNAFFSYLILLYKYDRVAFKRFVNGYLFLYKIRITSCFDKSLEKLMNYFKKETQDELPF